MRPSVEKVKNEWQNIQIHFSPEDCLMLKDNQRFLRVSSQVEALRRANRIFHQLIETGIVSKGGVMVILGEDGTKTNIFL